MERLGDQAEFEKWKARMEAALQDPEYRKWADATKAHPKTSEDLKLIAEMAQRGKAKYWRSINADEQLRAAGVSTLRRCATCDTEFTPISHAHTYCSWACVDRYCMKNWGRKWDPPNREQALLFCGLSQRLEDDRPHHCRGCGDRIPHPKRGRYLCRRCEEEGVRADDPANWMDQE